MKRWLAFLSIVLAGCQYIPGTDAKDVADAQTRVADQLSDPPAARFRNVVAHEKVICGEVNGKNGFGAYAGFERFSVDRQSGSIKITSSNDSHPVVSLECLTAEERLEAKRIAKSEADADLLADNLEAQADNLEAQADELERLADETNNRN